MIALLLACTVGLFDDAPEPDPTPEKPAEKEADSGYRLRLMRYTFVGVMEDVGETTVSIEKSNNGEFILLTTGRNSMRMTAETAVKLADMLEEPEPKKPVKRPAAKRPQKTAPRSPREDYTPSKAIRVERRTEKRPGKPDRQLFVIGDDELFTDNLVQVPGNDVKRVIEALRHSKEAVAQIQEKIAP